ncbi:putative galacturonosyltransferase 9 [Wolffia australiana]
MAPGTRSGRFAPPSPRSSLSPHRIFLSAIISLLFFAALCALIASSTFDHGINGADRGSLSLQSDPLRTRLDLINRQAADHVALINAYAAFARRAKIDSSRVLRTFEDLVGCFTSLLTRIPRADDAAAIEDEALKALEKELKDRLKLARQLVAESKESFDTQIKIQKLRDTVFAVGEQLDRERKLGDLSNKIAAGSTPKTLHCIGMRLMEDRILHPEAFKEDKIAAHHPDLENSELFHYAIFSDNVVAASVVINSAVRCAAEPSKHVFHIVTDAMHLAAFQVWFRRRPPAGGALVEVKSDAEFGFLNGSSSLDHLKFYLPEMFPRLKKVVLLEDDVVVQRDLAGLWSLDLGGKVNGAVEMCFGPFQRYSRYINFSHPAVKEKVSPRACAWAFGVNLFDLEAWRREKCTEQYHYYQNLNEDGSLWNPGSTLPVGLLTFYSLTKPLDKTWHVMGLGYNPSISPDQIDGAAVIHFNGNMKPWLDIAMNQYKQLWMKHVDTDMEFLQLCNFGL